VQLAVTGVERADGCDLGAAVVVYERQAVLDLQTAILQHCHLGLDVGQGGRCVRRGGPDQYQGQSQRQEYDTDRSRHLLPCLVMGGLPLVAAPGNTLSL